MLIFSSAGSISNTVVLIAFYRDSLLLYCLPLRYNFNYRTDHRFSIGFRSGPDGGHSIILSPLNHLCSKNLFGSLDTKEGKVSCLIYTSLWNWETGICYVQRKYFFPKSTVASTVQFKSIIHIESYNNELVHNSSPYPHITISSLPSFSHDHIWIG